jgi:hypothetical protein
MNIECEICESIICKCMLEQYIKYKSRNCVITNSFPKSQFNTDSKLIHIYSDSFLQFNTDSKLIHIYSDDCYDRFNLNGKSLSKMPIYTIYYNPQELSENQTLNELKKYI